MAKVTLFTHTNNAQSIVEDSPLAQAAVTLNVPTWDGFKFPDTFPFRLTIWDKTNYPNPKDDSNMEIVECTAKTDDALTIVRAKETTSDVAHAHGQAVEQTITSEVLTNIESAIPKETIINLHSSQAWANNVVGAPASIPETTINLTGTEYANCDVFFEVVLKIDSGYTGYADLYDLSAPGIVTGSQLSTVSTSPVILRTSAISLASTTNAHIVRYWSSDAGGWCNIYTARLISIHKT